MPDYTDRSLTENTRACYPIEHIENALVPCVGGHPQNIIFLTCDAFGVLPPVSRLTPSQATYHFLSGYTAKVAGTEVGVAEPQATFSACFGAAFLVLHPTRYAALPRRQDPPASRRRPGSSTRAGPAVPTASDRGSSWATPEPSSTRSTTARCCKCPPCRTRAGNSRFPRRARACPASCCTRAHAWPSPEAYDQAADKLAALFRENFEKYVRGRATGVGFEESGSARCRVGQLVLSPPIALVQQINRMGHLDRAASLLDLAGDLQDAADVAGHHHLSAGGFDVVHLALAEPLGHLGLGEVVGAGGSAADL